ncbi:MAG: hypothetical protein JWO31_4222, partial [Phycisphaerales bacterium]|nr:hypothetical protein [Phycisphaerales bacterium]
MHCTRSSGVGGVTLTPLSRLVLAAVAGLAGLGGGAGCGWFQG